MITIKEDFDFGKGFKFIKSFTKGERGDSNPRIAAPQAAALTTWRRPPHIYKFTNSP